VRIAVGKVLALWTRGPIAAALLCAGGLSAGAQVPTAAPEPRPAWRALDASTFMHNASGYVCRLEQTAALKESDGRRTDYAMTAAIETMQLQAQGAETGDLVICSVQSAELGIRMDITVFRLVGAPSPVDLVQSFTKTTLQGRDPAQYSVPGLSIKPVAADGTPIDGHAGFFAFPQGSGTILRALYAFEMKGWTVTLDLTAPEPYHAGAMFHAATLLEDAARTIHKRAWADGVPGKRHLESDPNAPAEQLEGYSDFPGED